MLKIRAGHVGIGCTLFCLCLPAACADPTRATSVAAAQREAESVARMFPSRPFKTLDEEFTDLVLSVPGFGGLYQEPSGAVQVYLVDVRRGPALRPIIAAFLRRLRMVDPGMTPRIEFKQARFDFRTLSSTYSRIKSVLPRNRITQTDIDETANQIIIGTLDTNAATSVGSLLENLAIDPRMVAVRVIPRTVVTSTTFDRVRPTIGGLRIDYNRSDGAFYCTMGFNARVGDSFTGVYTSARYFLTNSHCTAFSGFAADGVNNHMVFYLTVAQFRGPGIS